MGMKTDRSFALTLNVSSPEIITALEFWDDEGTPRCSSVTAKNRWRWDIMVIPANSYN